MAKSGAGKTGGKTGEAKKTFEERLERLEMLGDQIRKPDIPLDEALRSFEEGIKLARALEKDLEKIESRVEILMNGPESGLNDDPDDESQHDESDEGAKIKTGAAPELGLFDSEA